MNKFKQLLGIMNSKKTMDSVSVENVNKKVFLLNES